MKIGLLLSTAILAVASPVLANPPSGDITSTSGSNSDANSASTSGASSDNFNQNGQTQGQTANNAGIGNSTSGSASDANAVSGSISGSESNGNQQGQSQGQSANNDQGQSQGQSSALTNTNSLGQQASQGNQQGVTFTQTYNTTNRRKTVQEFRTNAAVPLAASSSFSSDYCGGTASGGVSAAPIGISIGGAGPTFDKSCQSLRRAEKFGMAAANWHNLGYDDRAVAMMRMMEWSICTSDSRGPKADTSIAEACDRVLDMDGSPPSAPTKMHNHYPEVTPEYTQPTVQPLPDQYKTPRGDLEFKSVPMIQDTPAMAAK